MVGNFQRVQMFLYCSSQKKWNRGAQEAYIVLTSLCYSNAKLTVKVLLTFNKVETKVGNFDFVHLFCFLFFLFHNKSSKSIWSLRVSNIPNDYCLANLLLYFTFLFWASCELWVLSYSIKTVHACKSLRILMRTFLGFLRNNCVGVARIVMPHLGYRTYVVQAARSVRISSLIVF